MNRSQHIARCKQRALAYLPNDPANAMASFLSDMERHPETSGGLEISAALLMNALLRGPDAVRECIEGFE